MEHLAFFLPGDQRVAEPFGSFTVEVKAGAAFKFTDGKTIEIFKRKQGMHEAFRSIDVRYGERTGRHFQNLCKALSQVFLGCTGAFFVLRHANVCGLFGKACSSAQEFQGQASKTSDVADSLSDCHIIQLQSVYLFD